MASIIATLRILYDGKETKPLRVMLEAMICGALSLCVVSIVEFFNLPNSAAITMGGAIGFIGVQTLCDFIVRGVSNRIDKE